MSLLDQGASADYESPCGMTCLLNAAVEDPESHNHKLQKDDDGRHVPRSHPPMAVMTNFQRERDL